jgi:hypothetical protein
LTSARPAGNPFPAPSAVPTSDRLEGYGNFPDRVPDGSHPGAGAARVTAHTTSAWQNATRKAVTHAQPIL